MTMILNTIDEFHSLVGKHLGYSEWLAVEQDRIDQFADATEDHQWIHVDPERAKTGPYGGTIAHGYFSLAVAPVLLGDVLEVRGMALGINYGCNKVRFPAPLMVGSKLRLGASVAEVTDVEGGVQVVFDMVLETDGSTKPCCAAQVVYRYFR